MANQHQPEGGQQINIELTDEVAKGTYSNLVVISHSPTEFVLDFIVMLPNAPARVSSRVISTPEHAKRLLAALSENVRKYEQQFGVIEEKGGGAPPFPPTFTKPKGQA